MTVILDGFFELEQPNRVRAFEIYNQSAKQGDQLAAFYNLCKNYGVGRSHEYPQVGLMSHYVSSETSASCRDWVLFSWNQ